MAARRIACAVALACLLAAPGRAQEPGPEAPSAPSAPPAKPEKPEAVVVGTTVRLSWRESDGAAGYVIERAGEAGEFAAVGETQKETAYADATVQPGQPYRYRLRARNAAGTSEPGDVLEVRTLLAPTDLVATLAAVDSFARTVTLEWQDAEPERIETFRVERRPAGAPDEAFEKLEEVKKSKKEKKDKAVKFGFTDESVDPGATYDYRVIGMAEGADSPPSAVARTPALEAPTAPRRLVAGAFTVDRIDLSWSDDAQNEDGYRVERRKPGAAEWSALATLGANRTSYADAVAAGQAFEYRVVALNAQGAAPSATVGARTPTRGPETQGFTGPSGVHRGPTAVPDTAPARTGRLKEHFSALPDRWRIELPEWNRYPERIVDPQEAPYAEGDPLNPYGQNVLKGDYPILGNDIFLLLEGTSDTLMEGRSFPIPSGASTRRPLQNDFFGDFDQFLFTQSFVMTAELFQGDAAFRPKDAAVKVTAVANINYIDAQERNLVNIDVREGSDRLDGWVGLQEALIDKHLIDLSPNYDFVTLIAGIQRFQSDFRGFMYLDNNLGARLQANYLSNRLQLNLAYFDQMEKETNSGLNRYKLRDQRVVIANLYFQDLFKEVGNALLGHDVLGYTFLLNYHFNRDHGGRHFDTNDFITRPTRVGAASGALGQLRPKDVEVHYLGFGGEGHIGPLNISHQYYLAFGEETFNEVAGKQQDVLAHFFALEASLDIDWLRVKGSYLYASGDRDPTSGRATGFSAIFDNPFFAGSGFSYFNRQNIPLVQTGAQLTNRLSLLPDLRSSKIEGSSNFVNPGLHLFNVGLSARITPKAFIDFNVNFLYFDHTESLQLVLVQDKIDRRIGVDYNVGFQYRPFLTDNVIVTAGAGVLVPSEGFRDIYTSKTLYSGFVALTLTY